MRPGVQQDRSIAHGIKCTLNDMPEYCIERFHVVLPAHHSKRQGARERREGDDSRHSHIY